MACSTSGLGTRGAVKPSSRPLLSLARIKRGVWRSESDIQPSIFQELLSILVVLSRSLSAQTDNVLEKANLRISSVDGPGSPIQGEKILSRRSRRKAMNGRILLVS